MPTEKEIEPWLASAGTNCSSILRSFAKHTNEKALCSSSLSLSAFALTPISDTVYTATGSTALPGSYLLIKWPRFASGANHPVLPNAQTVQLTNGVFRVSLEPTATAQHPFHYIVEYHLISANGPLPTYIETWDVPDTSAPQTIASVLVTSPTASGPPPLAKGDLATSDGVTGLVLHSPQQAGYILLTDPTAPTGLTYQPLTSLAGNYDAAGAAVAAQTAAEVYTDTFISRLGSAAQHAATDFDIAGLAVAAQASAKTYTDNAIATVTAGAITGAQMNTAIGTAIASLPTSGSSQTKPALLTAADWAVFQRQASGVRIYSAQSSEQPFRSREYFDGPRQSGPWQRRDSKQQRFRCSRFRLERRGGHSHIKQRPNQAGANHPCGLGHFQREAGCINGDE